LKEDPLSVVNQLLVIDDVKKLPKPMVMLQNRMTETDNYAFLNLLPSYLAFFLQVCRIAGVKTVIVAGDPIYSSCDDKQRRILDTEKGDIKVLCLNQVYKHPTFKKCFDDEAFISGQAWLLDALRPHLAAVMGPHSGSTEAAALLGLPTIIFSPDDHTSHPRIPRIANACKEWWKFIGCGTLQDMDEMKDLSFDGKKAITNALDEMLMQYSGGSSSDQHASDAQNKAVLRRSSWLTFEQTRLIMPSSPSSVREAACRRERMLGSFASKITICHFAVVVTCLVVVATFLAVGIFAVVVTCLAFSLAALHFFM